MTRSLKGYSAIIASLFVATAALIAVFSGSSLVEGEDRKDRRSHSAAKIPAKSAKQLKREMASARKFQATAKKKAVRRARQLAAPESREERLKSRTAFVALPKAEAISVAKAEQQKFMTDSASAAPELGPGQKLVGFSSETVGRVALSGKAREEAGVGSLLVQSFGAPIAVETSKDKFEAIDTALEESDDKSAFEPGLTTVPSRISKSLTGGIEVGDPETKRGLTVVPVGRNVAGTVVNGTKVFYANSGDDTDTVVEATARGASVSWLLRSPKASTTQELALELPEDGSLRVTGDGSAEISLGSHPLANVSIPVAFDAQGTQLPAKYTANESELSVSVEIGDGDVAYPIAIDPVISYSGDWVVMAGHAAASDYGANAPFWGMTKYFTQGTTDLNRMVPVVPGGAWDESGRPVLKIRTANSSSSYATAAHIYNPVRSTSVVRVEWQGVLKPNSGPGLLMGIVNASGFLPNQWGAYYDQNGTQLGAASSAFGVAAGWSLSSPVTVVNCAEDAWHCPPRRTGGENTAAYFELGAMPGVSAGQYATSLGAFVYLADNDNPTLTAPTNVPTGWKDPSAFGNSFFTVSDPSLGIGRQMDAGHAGSALMWNIDGQGWSSANGDGPICDGGAETPCPDSASILHPARLIRGKHQLAFKSKDIIGNTAPQQYSHEVKVDSEKPEIDLGGRLGTFALDNITNPNAKLRTIVGNAPFVVTANDGDPATPNTMRSGVKTLSAKLNKAKADGTEDNTASGRVINYDASNPGQLPKQNIADCDENNGGTKNSCSLSYGGTFDSSSLDPGIYYFHVTATDYLNHVSEKSFRVAVGVATLNGITEGQSTSRYVPMQVARTRGSFTQFSLQYRPNTSTGWCDLPAGKVQVASNAMPLSAWPQSLTGSTSEKVVVDLSDLRLPTGGCGQSSNRLPDGGVQFRALMVGAGDDATRASEDVTVNFDHGGKETVDETEEIGPGTVDLVTGNFSLTATDVTVDAYKADLTVSRTYNSRYTDKSSVLGPGWTLGIPVDSSSTGYRKLFDRADVRLPEDERFPSVEIESVDGSGLVFELAESPDGSERYVPEAGLEGMKLTRVPDPNDPMRTNGFVLTDLDGGETVEFTTKDDSNGFGGWTPTAATSPLVADAIRYKYTYGTDGKATIDSAFSSTGSTGIACGNDWLAIPRGCQALHFNYTNVGGNPTLRRLSSIALRTWDPERSTPQMITTPMVNYTYYSDGTLRYVWDPRIAESSPYTTYTHTQVGGQSMIATIKPPGEEPFTLNYMPKLAEDNNEGRLASVSRSALAAGTATTSVRYFIPTTLAAGSAAPYDLTAGAVAAWGQQSPPWMATAVFAADQPPNGSPATNYEKASITYMDPLARVVNKAEPGGRLDVSEYDDFGNLVRTLGAENRARAMSRPTPGERLGAADLTDSERVYEPVDGSLQSRRHLVKSLGPTHQVRLDDGTWVQGRAVTTYVYDENSPRLLDNTKEPFDLVTTERSGVQVGTVLRDMRKRTTNYGANDDEWKLRIPRLQRTDPDGLDITRKVTIEDGLETERTQPRSQSSSAPSTTRTIYYTAGANPLDDECDDRPEWLGLACKVGPGAQPSTVGLPGLAVKKFTYNYLRQPRVTTETVTDASGATKTRTFTKNYDEAGRSTSESTVADSSSAVKTTVHSYHGATGRETLTRSKNSDGSYAPGSISRVYDSLGRLTSYTDAGGHTSTVSAFDILSRPLTTNDGKAQRQNVYDPITGDLTSVADAGAGTFTGTYDADGRLIATRLPGAIDRTFQYDEAGSVIYTAYTRTTGCSSSCVIYEQFGVQNAHGQYSGLWETMSGQPATNQMYDFDAAGRLARVQDWRDDGGAKCIERNYEFDVDSNRTKRRISPDSSGACDSSSAGSVRNSTYDSADRLTDSGYVYDAFGRITTVPASGAGGSTNLTAAYFANDSVSSISQAGETQTFELDPGERVSIKTKSNSSSSATESYAYSDDSDSPAWTAVTTGSTTTWSRTVGGIDGAEASQDSATGVKLLIQNLRGDVVSESSTAGAISNVSKVDEFGVPKTPLAAGVKYAFHGSKQRESLTSAGIVSMGARLYQPEMGRFLQVDPVLGGTENPYEYPSDPINNEDLDGLSSKKSKKSAQLKASYSATLKQKTRCVWNYSIARCKKALRLAKMADRTTRKLFGLPKNASLDKYDGTKINAFRHCYWSALMTRRMGADAAKGIADIHEKYGKNNEKNMNMDLHNNAWGRWIGSNQGQNVSRQWCFATANNASPLIVLK